MVDVTNLKGMDYLDCADRIRFVLLNAEINENGKLSIASDIVDWNRIVERLQRFGVTDYEVYKTGDEGSNE